MIGLIYYEPFTKKGYGLVISSSDDFHLDIYNIMKYLDICGEDFKTKPEAYKFFRGLVKKTTINNMYGKNILLTEDTILKHSQVKSLFDRYLVDLEWYNRKSNGNTNINYVLIKDDYDDYCLGFKLEDGTVDSVTAQKYLTCFGKGTETDEERFHSAIRYEVKYQSEKYRENNQHIQECWECMAPKEIGLEVDHIIPFKNLIHNFFQIHNRQEFIKGVDKTQKGFYWRLKEPHRKLWCDYHEKHAEFQLLCKECHKYKTQEERKNDH